MKNNQRRIILLQRHLIDKNIDAFFVTDINNIKYLSGFSGSTAYLIVTKDKSYFFTDGRYTVQSKDEVDEALFQIVIVSSYNSVIEDYLHNYKEILVEKTAHVFIYDMILKEISSDASIHIDVDDTLLKMRSIKDDNEVMLIREQYRIAGDAFNQSIGMFKFGIQELEWAATLAYNMMKGGALGESFDTIVASGYRGAMPHGVATSKIVDDDEAVIIDFGSRAQYNSDYTRMIYSGKDKEVLSVIDIVYTALKKSIDFIGAGVKACDIDNVAREYIESKGYGKFFNHSLGHGVGLDVHELPTINGRSNTVIEDGMIFTIEPGIYLPDKFGVRLEDTVLIKNGRAEPISKYLNRYTYKI